MSMRSVAPRASFRGTSGTRCLRYCMWVISVHWALMKVWEPRPWAMMSSKPFVTSSPVL
jgi:hypothetical protein